MFLMAFNGNWVKQTCEILEVFKSLTWPHGVPPPQPVLSLVKEAGLSLPAESQAMLMALYVSTPPLLEVWNKPLGSEID